MLPLTIMLMSCVLVQDNVRVDNKVCTVSRCTDVKLDRPVSVLQCKPNIRTKAT